MTRRGSLAYYLAAWVCGCLFMSVGVWLPGGWESTHWTPSFKGAFGFVGSYFLSLVFGAFMTLLFALVLRRLTAILNWERLWQWVLTGAALAPLTVWTLALLGQAAGGREAQLNRWAVMLLLLFLGGPMDVFQRGLWVAIPVGVATSCVLYLIHRAFEPKLDSVQR